MSAATDERPVESLIEGTASGVPGYKVTRHVEATPPPAPKAETEDEPTTSRPRRPYHSGFCGPGPCRDEQHFNKAGELIRHCPYEIRNGEKASVPTTLCACTCHTDPNRAGQAVAAEEETR